MGQFREALDDGHRGEAAEMLFQGLERAIDGREHEAVVLLLDGLLEALSKLPADAREALLGVLTEIAETEGEPITEGVSDADARAFLKELMNCSEDFQQRALALATTHKKLLRWPSRDLWAFRNALELRGRRRRRELQAVPKDLRKERPDLYLDGLMALVKAYGVIPYFVEANFFACCLHALLRNEPLPAPPPTSYRGPFGTVVELRNIDRRGPGRPRRVKKEEVFIWIARWQAGWSWQQIADATSTTTGAGFPLTAADVNVRASREAARYGIVLRPGR
ncbi:MAG: hypothetical protein Q8P22_11185 [Chloroflexota bacterium]|nr:hypothetical protein [Chloroflexota bacterium]